MRLERASRHCRPQAEQGANPCSACEFASGSNLDVRGGGGSLLERQERAEVSICSKLAIRVVSCAGPPLGIAAGSRLRHGLRLWRCGRRSRRLRAARAVNSGRHLKSRGRRLDRLRCRRQRRPRAPALAAAMEALSASTIAVNIATVGPLSMSVSASGSVSAVAGSGAASPGPSRNTTPETVGT